MPTRGFMARREGMEHTQHWVHELVLDDQLLV